MPSSLDGLREAAAVHAAAVSSLHAAEAERLRLLRAARAEGVSLARLAAAAGLSRQRVFQLVGCAEPAPAAEPEPVPVFDEAAARARVAEVDSKWSALVDRLAEVEKPSADFVRWETAKRNGRRGVRARRGLPAVPTVLAEVRGYAESKVLRFLSDNRGVVWVDRVVAELDEAYILRKRLESLDDARAGL